MSVLVSTLLSSMVLLLHTIGNPSFFCELNWVVHRACSDSFLNDVVMYFSGATGLFFVRWCPLFLHQDSFLHRCNLISSGEVQSVSTCASQLSVVSLFYSIILGV
jgi:olfactory receptor